RSDSRIDPHAKSPLFIWAGAVGSAEEWKALESAWQTRLAHDSLPYFHMAECRAGVGIFTDWSLAQRDLITHDMRMIIRDRSVSPIGVGVPRADWDDVIGERLRPVYGSIDYAAIGISEEKAMTRAGDRLIITFDEGSEGSRLISEFAAEADRLVVI